MVGETIKSKDFDTFTPGLNLSWGDRILQSLDIVETDYVFFILEDYYLCYHHPLEQMRQYLSDMDRMHMNRLQISMSSYQSYSVVENCKYWKFDKRSGYVFSMQPSIWKKEWIRQHMNPTFSPWEFEINNSQDITGKESHTYIDPSISSEVYFNAVRKGFKKSDGWTEFFQKEKLEDIDLTVESHK